MREVLNHRNNLLDNLDEKERIAQKSLDYKKMYKNEINGLKNQ